MTAKKAPARPNSYQDHVSYTLSDSRRIRLFGEIALYTMGHIVNSLDYLVLQDRKKPIEITLNSQGGSVVDGLAIYDAIMQANKTTPVNITVAGSAMSMGAIILQAGRVRRAYPHSEFLLHEVSYGMRGRHSEHKDLEDQAEKLQQKLNTIIVERSHISLEELKKLTDRRDYTISAQEALQHGLIDEIIQ